MRRSVLAVAISVVLIAFGQCVQAQSTAYTWTGCYVGGNLGAGWSHNRTTDEFLAPGVDVGTNNGRGGAVGGQAGCDYQLGKWVVGARGLYDWSNVHGSNSPSSAARAVSNITGLYYQKERFGNKIHWMATATGRAGYEVMPQWLVFFDGGAAWVRNSYTDRDAATPGIFPIIGNASSTRHGWTIGGGTEYRLHRNWSVFAEYSYVQWGADNRTLYYVQGGCCYIFNYRQNLQTALFGINYRFGP